MSSKVFDNFVTPLRQAFDDPFDDMKKTLALYQRLETALDHFSADVLQQAVIRLQNLWQSRKFPTQAACVSACLDIHEKKGKQQTDYPVIRVNSPEWEAWEIYYQQVSPHKARLMNSSTRGSWTVPSLWPPGHNNVVQIGSGVHDDIIL